MYSFTTSDELRYDRLRGLTVPRTLAQEFELLNTQIASVRRSLEKTKASAQQWLDSPGRSNEDRLIMYARRMEEVRRLRSVCGELTAKMETFDVEAQPDR